MKVERNSRKQVMGSLKSFMVLFNVARSLSSWNKKWFKILFIIVNIMNIYGNFTNKYLEKP